RVYLTMGDYDKAKNYATECLNLHNKLLDFNSLDSNSLNPIPPLHEEVLYYTQGSFLNSLPYPYTMIDSAIASSYDINDLRKVIYMVQIPDNTFSYKRISNNGNYVFNGIAVDEVLLTRAECYARKGDVAAAMLDLNKLLEKRWKTGTFIPYA